MQRGRLLVVSAAVKGPEPGAGGVGGIGPAGGRGPRCFRALQAADYSLYERTPAASITPDFLWQERLESLLTPYLETEDLTSIR